MNRNARFGIGIGVILAAIGYFTWSGYQEGKAYYRTIDEVNQLSHETIDDRLRVAGLVQPGSITRMETGVSFTLTQDTEDNVHTLAVRYAGSQPVPDTFKDGAEAIVEGYRRADGSFDADHIQAKCASKYEAKYGKDAQHPANIPLRAPADSTTQDGY